FWLTFRQNGLFKERLFIFTKRNIFLHEKKIFFFMKRIRRHPLSATERIINKVGTHGLYTRQQVLFAGV
ncbi:hypothetical protein, partial [Prevotella fusca]